MCRAFVVLAAVLLATGCGRRTSAEGHAYVVRITPAAAKEADGVGVDLHRLIAAAADKAIARLPHRGRVTIRVSVDASQTIPGVGVGGYTRGTGDVDLYIVAYPDGLRRELEDWLPRTVAHELHHSSRIRTGPGYGPSLADALVAEGLADRFADSVFPKARAAPWDHSLSRAEELSAWKGAQPMLYTPGGYVHSIWFFDGGELPRWTGYSLGYDLVEPYLRAHRSSQAAVHVPTRRVLAAFHGFQVESPRRPSRAKGGRPR